MATIFSLPPYLIDRIYIHIHDRKSIQALFGTSLYFQRHVKENERYRRMAEYTAACYEVVATNLDHEPMWFRLKHAKVIQIGEHHNIEWERVVFAHLLHGIWYNRRDSLLIEHEPYCCRGQIRFVHPAIASQAVCWDISSAEKEALKYIKCMDTAFAISQKTLLANDERMPSAFLAAFSQLNEMLYAYYPGIPHFMLQKPYQEYLKAHFAHRRSIKTLNEKRLILMLQTYQVALAAVDHYFYFGTLSLYEDSIQRDFKFVSEIFDQIQKKGKKRVITMSGTAHSMKGGYVHSQLERYGLPYLSLIGKGALRQELSHKKGSFPSIEAALL